MPLGAVASGDPHSALAGRNALLEGGNAVDAAVAAGLMAAFTLQPMTGLGGSGLMTIRAGDVVEVLDFNVNLPGRGREGQPRPEPDVVGVPFEGVTEEFLVGAPTVAVPGVVAGLWEAHARHGRLPTKELAFLAIEAARKGIPVTDAAYRAFALLQGIQCRSPDAWALVGDEGGLHVVGRKVRNEDLAWTFEQLVEEGPRAFYEGEIADRIVASTDGLLTRDDLAAYEPVWRKPLRTDYRGSTVYMPAVPSLSGGMLFAALADLARGQALPATFRRRDWWRLADAMRRGETVRTAEYERRLFEEGWLEGVVASSRSGCTMHISTIDADGVAVAYTSSVGEGSGIVAPGTGFLLNNFLGEPDILPPGGTYEAGRRMMTSMCPTVVHTANGGWMSLGSAGSDRIRSALLQVLVHVLDGDVGLQEAISRPRIHTRDDTLYIEGYGRTPQQVHELREYGLRAEVTWAPGFFFGGVQAVAGGRERFDAGADTVRRGGVAYVA